MVKLVKKQEFKQESQKKQMDKINEKLVSQDKTIFNLKQEMTKFLEYDKKFIKMETDVKNARQHTDSSQRQL